GGIPLPTGGFQGGPRTSGGGGVTPGGGGGGTPRTPGGGRTGGGGPRSQQNRGPDFFASRVTDDPQTTPLYDPQLDTTSAEQFTGDEDAAEEQEPLLMDGEKPPTAPRDEKGIQAPRLPVAVEALEQLGVIVISGKNPSDVEEMIRIIDY